MLSSISKPVAAGAAIGVVAVLVAFAPARAVPVNVSYNLSSITYFSGQAQQNVLTGTGSLTVQFLNGTAGGHVGTGPLHVVSGTAMLTSNIVQVPNQLSITGNQLVNFGGSGVGAVTGGGAFTLNTVGHIASGMVHCFGTAFLCNLAGFNLSVPQSLTSNGQTLHITVGALVGFPSLGPQTMFNGVGTGMSPMGGTLIATVVGNEVGVRQVVPEPGTGLLLGFGLAGFGIAATSWRARRRRA